VYCGAQYGHFIASILVQTSDDAAADNRGGTDGNRLARQGRGAATLVVTGMAAFFAACLALLVLVAGAPLLASLAVPFGPAETFALLVLGLTAAAMLASGSRLKAFAMVLLGLLLGLVGRDGDSGVVRFGFGFAELDGGISLVALAMGVYGYGETLTALARSVPTRQVLGARLSSVWPGWQALRAMAPAVLRGSALGALLGMLPGGGARMSGFAALAVEKRVKGPDGEVPVGEGNIRAVVAPGAASQAGAQSAFLPLLALGLPANAVMVLLLGALQVHQLHGGPQLAASEPALFWGLIAALWLVNLMLALLSLPLIGLWSRLLRLPERWLYPAIVLCCAIGVYTLHRSIFDVWLVAGFGLAGYVFHQLGMVPAPLLLGFALGPALEGQLEQALHLSQGDWSIFVRQPLSVGLLLAALAVLFVLPAVRSRHRETFVKE
jgi:TctA family transporter